MATTEVPVAAEDAILSIPAVKEGVVAGLGPMRLACLIGAAPASRLCLLGQRFTAQEGATLGLIAEVVPPDQLEQRALKIAQELLAIPFTALRHTKRQIARAFDSGPATAFDQMVAAQEECLRSPEHAAVMDAYRATQAARRASADVSPDEPAKGGAR